MRNLLFVLCLLATAGCDGIAIDLAGPQILGSRIKESPVVNLPVALRQRNWLSPALEGSCTHATTVMLFRWQNMPNTAEWWRQNHSGGETPQSLCADLDAAGIRYVMTVNERDVAFLEWAVKNRRGCGVTVMGGRHFVLLADITDTQVAVIDNNDPENVIWHDRETFLTEWFNSNSWALVPVYSPIPERP